MTEQAVRVERSAALQSSPVTAQDKLSNAAKVLRLQALEAAKTGRFTDAESLFATSLATFEDLETLNSYAFFLDSLGELSRAQQIFERIASISEKAGDQSLLATAYANIGQIHNKRGDFAAASKYWTLASRASQIKLIGNPDGPIEFYSCFISYSEQDREFAEQIYADLQANGVRCWFAPHHIQAGKKLHEQIDTAIRLHERLLLIISSSSINSEWVRTEIATALRREAKEGRRILFPIRLNISFEDLHSWESFDADAGKDSARDIREYYIPDFTNWKDPDQFQNAFKKLLRDLKRKPS